MLQHTRFRSSLDRSNGAKATRRFLGCCSRLVGSNLTKAQPSHAHAQPFHLRSRLLAGVGCRSVSSTWRADSSRRDNGTAGLSGRLLGFGVLLVRIVAQLLYALSLLLGLLLGLVKVDIGNCNNLLCAQLASSLLCAEHARLLGSRRGLLERGRVCYAASSRLWWFAGCGGCSARAALGSRLVEGRRGAANDGWGGGARNRRRGLLDSWLVPRREEVVLSVGASIGCAISSLTIGDDDLSRVAKFSVSGWAFLFPWRVLVKTYSWASLAARLLSSSLYLVAVLDWYLVLGSLLLSAAVPPLDWKNLVADSLPPTFIMRSWSHCHSEVAQYQRRLR